MVYIAVFLIGFIVGFILCFFIIEPGDKYIIRKNKIKNSKDVSQIIPLHKVKKKRFKLFRKKNKNENSSHK